MIIDFHSHIFPDKIASSTISALESKSNGKAYTDGTVNGLIKSITENNVDISITLPVLTKPTQFDSVTRFVLKVNDKFLNSKHRIINISKLVVRVYFNTLYTIFFKIFHFVIYIFAPWVHSCKRNNLSSLFV